MLALPPTQAYASTDTYAYFSKHCPDQATYRSVIEQVAACRAEQACTPSTIMPQNKIVTAWLHCLSLSQRDKKLGRPLSGLRIIQICHFASSQGWLRPADLPYIIDMLGNCGILDKTKQVKSDYAPLQWMYNSLEDDCACALPHHAARFKLILNQYCQQHRAPLEHLSTKLTKLAVVPVVEGPPATIMHTASAAENLAATTLQSHVQRWNAGQNTIFPRQIAEVFDSTLLRTSSQEPVDQLVFEICRQITRITTDPASFRGKNLIFSIPKHTESNHSMLPQYWGEIRLASDGKSVKVLLTNTAINPLDAGQHKQVSKAQQFSIPLTLDMEERRQIKYVRKVIIQQLEKSNGDSDTAAIPSPSHQQEESLLFNSYDVTQRIKELCPDIRLVKRSYLDPSVKPSSFNDLLQPFPDKCKEPWLNCSLKYAAESRKVPLDFTDAPPMKELDIRDFLPWFIAIARQLESIHKVGIVHLDPKSENILLEEGGGTINAYLTDWDLAIGIGSLKDGDYFYWTRSKLQTPCDDVYGLAIALVETMVPTFDISLFCGRRDALKSRNNQDDLLGPVLTSFSNRIPEEAPLLHHIFLNRQPSEVLTELCKQIEQSLNEETISAANRRLLHRLAVEALAAQLALGILDQVLEMEDKATEVFSKDETIEMMTKGSLCDRLNHLDEVMRDIPLVNNFTEVLLNMHTQLNEFDEKLEKCQTN